MAEAATQAKNLYMPELCAGMGISAKLALSVNPIDIVRNVRR
jgi:hypothetical protein